MVDKETARCLLLAEIWEAYKQAEAAQSPNTLFNWFQARGARRIESVLKVNCGDTSDDLRTTDCDTCN